jgi:hypothetical protein
VRRFEWVVVAGLSALVGSLVAHPVYAQGSGSTEEALERSASSNDAEEAARGHYLLGEMDEEAMRFRPAMAHYDASITRLPSSRYAQSAAARSATLMAHSEGNFEPLVRLEIVRRNPLLSGEPDAIEALVKEAESFPPGRVRVEARQLAAEAYRGRLHRPAAEIGLLWLIVADPAAGDVDSREAASEIVVAEIAEGDLDAAARARAVLGTKLDDAHASLVTRLLRRRAALAVAKPVLGIVLMLFGVGVARRGAEMAARAALRVFPLAVSFCLFVGALGGFLATSYDSGNALPFFLIAPAMLLVILVARAWGAVGSTKPLARILRAALCASSLLAVALLLLDRLTPQCLEGLGL